MDLRLASLLLVTLVTAVGVKMFLDIDIPEGFQDPLSLRIQFTLLQSLKIYGKVMVGIFGVHETVRINRDFMNGMDSGASNHGLRIVDETFDGVGVRIYSPEDGSVSDAAVIYMHGGGWIYGGLDGYVHGPVVDLTRHSRLTVISVDYRLAPEYPYPIPFEDCLKAVEYFLTHADEYGVNSNRVAVMGDSAGGNLAAAVALALRDKAFTPKPKLQLLLYPVLQAIDFFTPSMQKNFDHPITYPRGLAFVASLYAFGNTDKLVAMTQNMHTSSEIKTKLSTTLLDHGTIPSDLIHNDYLKPKTDFGNDTMWKEIEDIFLDPYFAPLMAESVSDLPQAYVMTVEQDVLRDEGIWYAQRLQSAGNRVTQVHYQSAFHGILSFPQYAEYNQTWQHVYEYLKKEL